MSTASPADMLLVRVIIPAFRYKPSMFVQVLLKRYALHIEATVIGAVIIGGYVQTLVAMFT